MICGRWWQWSHDYTGDCDGGDLDYNSSTVLAMFATPKDCFVLSLPLPLNISNVLPWLLHSTSGDTQ